MLDDLFIGLDTILFIIFAVIVFSIFFYGIIRESEILDKIKSHKARHAVSLGLLSFSFLIIGWLTCYLVISTYNAPNVFERIGIARAVKKRIDKENLYEFERQFLRESQACARASVYEECYPIVEITGMNVCAGDFNKKECSDYIDKLADKINKTLTKERLEKDQKFEKKANDVISGVTKYRDI